jgi:hypothetical protein
LWSTQVLREPSLLLVLFSSLLAGTSRLASVRAPHRPGCGPGRHRRVSCSRSRDHTPGGSCWGASRWWTGNLRVEARPGGARLLCDGDGPGSMGRHHPTALAADRRPAVAADRGGERVRVWRAGDREGPGRRPSWLPKVSITGWRRRGRGLSARAGTRSPRLRRTSQRRARWFAGFRPPSPPPSLRPIRGAGSPEARRARSGPWPGWRWPC